MKAVVVTEEGVRVQNVETPKPKENQVLVKVFACGLNRADQLLPMEALMGHLEGQELQSVWNSLEK